MEIQGVAASLALLAGILSFLSPCLLPLVPGYVGYMSGRVAGANVSRGRVLSHAVSFVLGFSIVLVLLGASVGLVGYLVYDYMPLIRRIGGVVLIVFGLNMAGLIRIPILYREARLEAHPSRPGTYPASFLLGTVFGLGWTPCIGPTLAAILLLAGTSQTVAQGALLLAVYSAGLGIPFIVTALALGRAKDFISRLNRRGNVVSWASGVLLIAMGIMVYTDVIARMPAIFTFMNWVPFNL